MSSAPNPTNPPDTNPHHSRQDGDVREYLPPDLALLLDALRQEFNAKVSNLKAWGFGMCLAGGTLGGIITAFFPQSPADAASAVGSFLPF